MDIVVSSDAVRVNGAETLASFSVVSALPLDELDSALRAAGLGHVHDGHAWIAADRLRERAAALVTAPDWHDQYGRMVDYAVSKGWWDEEHRLIRAHVQQPAEYPFSARPAPEAVAQFHRVAADRPMTRVRMSFGGDVWVVHRNAAAREVLTDARFVREPFRTGSREVPYFVPFPAFLKTTLQFEDPPHHTKLRRLVQRAISPAAVKKMRDSASAFADELLEAMAAKGNRANLVTEYALALPIQMLANLLGVPADDHEKFERWASSTLAVAGAAPDDIARDMGELHAYLTALIAARRIDPREDLISSLARAQDADETLADEEILTIAMLLLVAGFDNTANFITIGVSSLLHHPDQLAAFREDPAGLAPTAVEEVLRHGRFSLGTPVAGIGGLVPFVATEAVEIDGVVIAEGEAVLVDPASVNHDGIAAEHDDRFDITREQNTHLTLSYGLHHCLGAPLARMEMQVALERLFTRFPNVALDGDPVVNENHLSRPIVELNVRW